MSGGNIFILILLALAVLTLFAGVKTVSQGYNWTVERFGKYTKTLLPGLNFIMPFFDRIGRKINMMEQVIDIPQQDVISRDNATVTVDGIAFFQVFDAAKASYEVSNLHQAIVTLTMTNIRSVMGGMDLDSVLSHRDEINERLLRVVDAAVAPWGVKVNRIEIKDIVPPSDLVEAMGRQMKAERVKRADILQAEGQRQSDILRAEGAKQAQILEAEGRKEAAFRDAEGRERLAQAEAKATEVVSVAIAQGDVAALNYFVAEKYLKAFALLAESPNQKVLMLPIEATSVLASLGGIGEIARQTFGGGDRPPGAPATAPRRPTGPADNSLLRADGSRHGTPLRARRLELVHRRRHPARARAARARRLHAVARALGAARRRDLAVGRLAVAGAGRHLRGLLARLDPGVAALRTQGRGAGRPALPQPPRRRVRRPHLRAGEADHEWRGDNPHRRHDLAGVGP